MRRRAAGLAAVGLVVALLSSACLDAAPGTEDPPGGAAPASSGEGSPVAATVASDPSESTAQPSDGATISPSTPGDGVVVADPEHAVEPPGPRRRDEAIMPPDMMIYNAEEPLRDETVEAIVALDGVEDAARMSMAQVSLENRVYTVGVVDPATYRLFTPVSSALFQRAWVRVAGGEVAVAPAVRRRLPIDDEGFLRLGTGEQRERIHVGAFAPQVDGVDAVVNSRWGDELGIPAGNALLVRTGQTAPQALRPEVSRIVGGQATIQDLDAVARYGIDPDATQAAFPVGGASQAIGTFRYTAIGDGRIAPDPGWVASHISTEEVPILGSVTCNRFIMPQLRAALSEIVARGLSDELDPGEYAGCYYPRFIAGTTTLSNHSFGTALDLNVPGNQRGTVGEMDRTVVSIFKKWGFAWGGDWGYTDPMHFEADRIVAPR